MLTVLLLYSAVHGYGAQKPDTETVSYLTYSFPFVQERIAKHFESRS